MASEAILAPGADPLEKLLLKLRARDVISDVEEAVLRDGIEEIEVVAHGKVIVRSGVTLSRCTLVSEGFVCRYQDLKDGQRQIMEMHVPGDFVDLHSFMLKRLEHNIGTLTPVRLAYFPHDTIRRITEEHPHLARMLWFLTLLDAAIHRERILSIGRRPALARIAHLLCEMHCRLKLVEMVESDSYRLPITQTDIADACGLTPVHVNRMLKQLRDQGLVTFRNSEVVIHEWDRLQRVAEFNDSYLFLERRPH